MKNLIFALPLLLVGCVMHEFEERIPGNIPVNVSAVIQMSQEGVPEGVVIDQIRTRGVERPTSTEDILAMKQAGVSDDVVRTMINAPVTPLRAPEIRRTVVYDTGPAETAVGIGLLAGWALFGHHYYDHYHWGYYCGY